jgi:DNA-binding NarL/FixJ family response regulator
MNIPVVLLTNLSDDTTIREGFARQAAGYLIKSYQNPQQILDEVKEILKI